MVTRARDGSPSEGEGRKRRRSEAQEAKVPSTRKASAAARGGVYIPPFKLAQMMKEVGPDKQSESYQRLAWDALRKSINGLVNKVNKGNLKEILPEIFGENLVRGKGLFVRSLMKSQMASPAFTNVYASLVAVINTKFPEIGELLVTRVVLQFRRAYKRNDKPICTAACKFIAHLVNQQVEHELLALEILALLLENPSNDSVELAVTFVKEVGAMLLEVSPKGLHSVFERFRGILHEGEIHKRVQFIIEGLFTVRKTSFEDFPAVLQELDLVEIDDQITHELSLEDKLDAQSGLDVFKLDPNFEESEREYGKMKKEILGESSSEEEDSDGEGSEEEDSEEERDEGPPPTAAPVVTDAGGAGITDMTETDLVNLRRSIYLTIMSALDFEEAGHKLMKIKIPEGKEDELSSMIIECCSQERTYVKYYGLLAHRFCQVRRVYQDCFAEAFHKQYKTIHRLETNKLRNVAKLFAHLLETDGLPWSVLTAIKITEDDTTSSSRIFIKILFQELAASLGLKTLNERLQERSAVSSGWYDGVFPKNLPKDTRFSINFFTSIGLGGLTDDMRAHLKNLPKTIMQNKQPNPVPSSRPQKNKGGRSDSCSYSGSYSYSGSSYSYSYSYSGSYSYSDTADSGEGRKKGKK
ncbi:pre-mRNA-splicing factor Cwc22 [Chloropicon primus]|uniref:Pre-mRNA-splicing factor Cwc22 n=2 Tax=Chloropicon primus TaxID=1764295 RepID=A0A5B8MTM4_9CHLO|nr:pre-mRNA-splicing factor Cwc22 [Chloropicon primus]UPR02900.1 pre-mRNA-splicing factor Cwc22 [Chloropicon primus]|eukprot:QDZ23687.1 pre-mRNA-splicing factor Cwc22 [Chloropicon primus]